MIWAGLLHEEIVFIEVSTGFLFGPQGFALLELGLLISFGHPSG